MDFFELMEATDFTLESCAALKRDRNVFVVFSTCGDREARTLGEKLDVLAGMLGNFIDRIYLSHRRVSADEDSTETAARKHCPGIEIFHCEKASVPDMGNESGKGSDMRRILYHINDQVRGKLLPSEIVVVFLDADVVPDHFGPHFVLGLSGAVLSGNDFAKASFWREMGRVKKFVAQPLFSVIDHPGLKKLTGFYYPLSGEVAGTLEFFNSVPFWQMYGVETGIGIDSSMGSRRVADVNLGTYDHDHHGDVMLQKMAFGIIRTYFLQLVEYGIIELSPQAKISDIFRASYIDDRGERRKITFDLAEKKYSPLKDLAEGGRT